MTDSYADSSLDSVVETVGEILAEAFQDANVRRIAEDPNRRHQLYVILLRAFGQYTPGFDINRVRSELEQSIGEEQWKKVTEHADKLTDLLPLVVHPTYTTTSYWSPIDGRRRTTIHRPMA